MLRVGCSLSPWSGSKSKRCRLFLREEGNALLFDRRRCRLDNTAAGEKIPAGGTFPIFTYNSSISFFCAACRVWTSVRCLSTESIKEMNDLLFNMALGTKPLLLNSLKVILQLRLMTFKPFKGQCTASCDVRWLKVDRPGCFRHQTYFSLSSWSSSSISSSSLSDSSLLRYEVLRL